MDFQNLLSHPARFLKRELEARERSQKDFAYIIGVSAPYLNALLKEKKNLTPALCVRIGEAFGTSPEVWMNLQSQYNLEVAKMKEKEKIKKVHQRVKDCWYELITQEDSEKRFEQQEIEEQEQQEHHIKATVFEPAFA